MSYTFEIIQEIDSFPKVIKFYDESDVLQVEQATKDLISGAEAEIDERSLRDNEEDIECFWIELRIILPGNFEDCPFYKKAKYYYVADCVTESD